MPSSENMRITKITNPIQNSRYIINVPVNIMAAFTRLPSMLNTYFIRLHSSIPLYIHYRFNFVNRPTLLLLGVSTDLPYSTYPYATHQCFLDFSRLASSYLVPM